MKPSLLVECLFRGFRFVPVSQHDAIAFKADFPFLVGPDLLPCFSVDHLYKESIIRYFGQFKDKILSDRLCLIRWIQFIYMLTGDANTFMD